LHDHRERFLDIAATDSAGIVLCSEIRLSLVPFERVILKKIALHTCLTILSLCSRGGAEVEEYTLKALFMEATTRFISWPDIPQANLPQFSDTTAPFIIAILGEDTIKTALEKIFKDKKIKGKRVEVRSVTAVSEIPRCHMLFISKTGGKVLPPIVPVTSAWPILTVGDTPGYSEKGVIMNLFLEESRVRFTINDKAAQQCGLKISYLLLKMGKNVSPNRGTP
jgi:hypothetical protein